MDVVAKPESDAYLAFFNRSMILNTQMHPTANAKYSIAADKFRPLFFIAAHSCFGRRPRGLPPIGLGAWLFIADGL